MPLSPSGERIEDRTHFGAWVIVSAPLILGYDVRDGIQKL